jgi:outer membrane protein assembly factor BamD (BamD/ComL family)
VSLLDGGRNAAAATALRAFLARHGGDPRAEDASYLLALALQRTGDAVATRAAARDYLQRYPSGFRRSQIEALAAPTGSGR